VVVIDVVSRSVCMYVCGVLCMANIDGVALLLACGMYVRLAMCI
jgi:hypothetical protein